MAKRAAPKSELRDDADKKITAASAALQHAACQLGVVTHAANNHKTTVMGRDGQWRTITKRDSTIIKRGRFDKPLPREKNLVNGAATANPGPLDSHPGANDQQCGSHPDPAEPSLRKLKLDRLRKHKKADKQRNDSALHQLIIDNAASAQPQAYTATDRMAAFRARLACKSSSIVQRDELAAAASQRCT